MATISLTGATLGKNLTGMLMADDILPGSAPSYDVCKQIFAFHPLGGKIAKAPIAMAMSQPREITVPNSPGERVTQAFKDEWKAIGANNAIFTHHVLKRVYGIASLAIVEKGKPPAEPLDMATLWKSDIAFSVLDPLNTAGSLVLNQDPNSIDFLKTTNIAVNGVPYHKSRSVVALNGQAIYLEYTASAFGYVGRSSYQAGLYLLKSFVETMIADNFVAKKAGVIVAKLKQAGSIINQAMQRLFGEKRDVIKESQTNNVISIDLEEAIESLNLQNVNGAMDASRKHILNNLAASDDMPAILLNEETFGSDFHEGSEDAKQFARYIDRVREDMEPTYAWMDDIVRHRAWNEEFYEAIQKDFPEEYGSMSYDAAFYQWKTSFSALWPSLLKEPDSKLAEAEDVKLKAVIAMLEVLMPALDPSNKATLIKWSADNFNGLKLLFPAPLNLDYETLESYVPPVAEKEPEPGEPFAAHDAQVVLRPRLVN